MFLQIFCGQDALLRITGRQVSNVSGFFRDFPVLSNGSLAANQKTSFPNVHSCLPLRLLQGVHRIEPIRTDEGQVTRRRSGSPVRSRPLGAELYFYGESIYKITSKALENIPPK